MILVTGGAGFLGSAIVWKLNQLGREDILITDRLGRGGLKWKNLAPLRFADYQDKDALLSRVRSGDAMPDVTAVIHMGACSSTTEQDADYLMANNYRYTVELAEWAAAHGKRFIYASSAATYGDGSAGFDDDDAVTRTRLRPLNMYGYSKHLFDLYALRTGLASRIAGLKFFNVFGPNEFHKGDMASVVYKAVGQIRETGKLRLFRSDRPEAFPDGGQKRDFIYVKDIVAVILWLLERPEVTGIYNLGTGEAQTWNDLAAAVFQAMGREMNIEYFDMPATLRGKYQDFTQATMGKLRAAGYTASFTSLEQAVGDYVGKYLADEEPVHLGT